MKDASRKIYICAVTLEHVQFVGPFDSFLKAANWGRANFENPCWNTVTLFPHDVATPLELVTP